MHELAAQCISVLISLLGVHIISTQRLTLRVNCVSLVLRREYVVKVVVAEAEVVAGNVFG